MWESLTPLPSLLYNPTFSINQKTWLLYIGWTPAGRGGAWTQHLTQLHWVRSFQTEWQEYPSEKPIPFVGPGPSGRRNRGRRCRSKMKDSRKYILFAVIKSRKGRFGARNTRKCRYYTDCKWSCGRLESRRQTVCLCESKREKKPGVDGVLWQQESFTSDLEWRRQGAWHWRCIMT